MGGVGFVVSHPFHERAVKWMGHPWVWVGLEFQKLWVGHLPNEIVRTFSRPAPGGPLVIQ